MNNSNEASISLRVALLIFTAVVIGALSYFVWAENWTTYDSGDLIIEPRDTTSPTVIGDS